MSNYFTIREIADKYKLKYQTIWKWIKKGDLKARKINGEIRILRSEWTKFINNPD